MFGMPKHTSGDRLVAEQTRVIYIYSLLSFLSLVGFGSLQILEGNAWLGILEVIGGLVAVLIMIGLYVTHNVAIARNMLLLCILTFLIVMIATGGTAGTGIFWLFLFPVSAFFLAGKKGGLLWMAALLSAVLIFMMLQERSLVTLPYSFITLRQMLITLLVVTIGIYAYQQSRENMAVETLKSQETSVEEKLKAEMIIENIDEGVVALSASGKIVLASHAGENLLGWKSGQLVGKNFFDAIPMVDAAGKPVKNSKRPMWLALNEKKSTKRPATYLRRDKSALAVDITSKAIVVDGKVRGAIGTFRDITEESAIDRAKSEFVTLASHQLRTPISAIAWMSELLMHGDAGKLKTEQADYVQQIYHSNKRMAALVDAMLTTSSLELGSLPIRPEPVDLPRLCRQILEQLLDTLPADKILHIKEHYDPALPTESLDPNVMKTILQNLITNAFKYTPKNGTVTITIKKSNEKLNDSPGDNLLIEVADTGMGVPIDEQSKIFTKLFRATNVKHQDTDGTGLGLYIVKTITEYVGGKIRFESEEGKGSTFSVLLPLTSMSKKEETA
jgi:PAS domain S-box-containing protein